MLIDPLALEAEAELLPGNPYEKLQIHQDCVVITPFHRITNQFRELSRGNKRHGSCGMGVGETFLDTQLFSSEDWKDDYILYAKDLADPQLLKKKLSNIKWLKHNVIIPLLHDCQTREDGKKYPFKEMRILIEEFERNDYVDRCIAHFLRIMEKVEIIDGISIDEKTIFEGAQGVLLDPIYGFTPYVTKTNTTVRNALKLDKKAIVLGVLRCYQTRHGPGPLVTESSFLSRNVMDAHNRTNPWQGQLRIGFFDLVAARYAIAVNPRIDALAITNLDRLKGYPMQVCHSYLYQGDQVHLLDQYFDYQPIGDSYEILAIKPQTSVPTLTGILSDCVPFHVVEASQRDTGSQDGWKFINYLEKELNIPVTIISTGPTWEDKTIL